ncbi:MAG: L-serine ammonia-lyase, iron-sulfur-dependent subunit beta [Flammeovirgaceae bacterium]|nr:L-serine ammonia-lyase, iron-sulfur-dependent subunit beta [Flammeovirgaceae bacterium]MDW8286910.1 L-serine ammonia-lyase, iron-sulfur-dependent subunit beta [Flammeovirgaceae bacterium]
MAERSSIFDMIGPVMIGPSSSHTAGVVKIGKVAIKILGAIPDEAKITFYNSFARTYEGHGSDRAIIAGLLGFNTDDTRIKQALDIAKEQGLKYTFRSIGNASTLHPNTVRLNLKKGEKEVEVLGISKGGGVIAIVEVNGFSSNFAANLHTLIILAEDRKGTVSFISSVIANDDCNIANMIVSRKGKNDLACQFYEMDSGLRPITIEYLKSLPWIESVTYLIPDNQL